MASVAMTDAQRERATRSLWPLTLLLTLCFTLSYVDRHVIGLLVDPIKAALSLSDTQIGLIQGLSFSLFYVAASLPLARWSDRGNRPRIMSACIAVWSGMTMLCGLAASFWQLLMARIGVAVSEAGLPPAALTMMADSFDAKRLARATSIFMLAPYLGGGIALLGGGALYGGIGEWAWIDAVGLGGFERWQLVFMLVGAPGLLVALIVLTISEPRASGAAAVAKQQPFSELFVFLRENWKFYAAYMASIALMTLLLNAMVSWLPAAMMRAHGVDQQTVGAWFGPIFLIAGSAGTLSAGLIIGRSEHDVVGRTLRFMRWSVAIALPAAALGPVIGPFEVQLALISVAIFVTSSVTGLSSLPLQFVAPSHLRAQAIAVLGLVSALLGTGLGPVLVGLLSDSFQFAPQPLSLALGVVGAMAVAGAFAMLSYVSRRHVRQI
jgi:MFS family permease